MNIQIKKFDDGYAICGDSTDNSVVDFIKTLVDKVPLIIVDPPYGNIVNEAWDKTKLTDDMFCEWMVDWTKKYTSLVEDKGAFYVWGGIGKPGFRPFLKYMHEIEEKGKFELANLITWSKKRAYGVSNNYLFTREELAYFCKGYAKQPRTFNIPLLETKRDYAGFNAKYPAKSEFYRRTNVWTDVNEMFSGKVHPTQKQQRVIEIPIEVHTNIGEYVLDFFAGSGTTAFAARKLGRKFIVVEQDQKYFDNIIERLDKNG